ncbi:Methionyl-tRNA synthetase, partial [Trinorchestia longiramus]
GCVLSADCYARFCRLRGDNVIYICGTDEYGTATETKAIGEGLTPQQICDKYHKIHSDVYKDFNISFDHFGRTTCPSQTDIVQELFWDLEKAGKISRETVEQLYCDHCSRFLADRFVEGTCPHLGCGYEDARGDQCDGCGKLVNAAELISPRCKLCSKTPKIKSSNHLFIDLPKIEADMRTWFVESSKKWSNNASSICNTWLRDGLLPRCITRDLKWGVPVPLEGYKDKVFYVWFDAPIGYLSITKEYTKDWEKWWKNPEQVKLYQFMAKDNVPFHGVIFPCTLTGSPKPWTRVTNLMATEYLNYEDGKFSKSRGVGVFGDQAMQTGIPSDVWRFYLLYIRPESQDTAFSWSDLQMKNNTELLNNLGNFVNRSLKFVSQFYNGEVPEAKPSEADFRVIAAVNHELGNYVNALSNVRLRDGLRYILCITRIGNQYIQDNEPYKLIKPDRSAEDKERGASVISVSVNIVYLVALCLQPYMPDTSAKILAILNLPDASHWYLPTALPHAVPAGCKVTKPEPLIKKITDDDLKLWQAQFQGTDEDSSKTPAKKKSTGTASPAAAGAPVDVDALERRIAEQGDKVRALKAGGASKADIAADVAVLLQLKQQLALAQGLPAQPQAKNKKQKKGEVVRGLKSSGAAKETVSAEVATLLQLKAQLAAALGVDVAALFAPSKTKKKK